MTHAVMKKTAATVLAIAVLLAGLPLAGVALKGAPVGQYLEFPPLTRYVDHAGFSIAVFSLLGLFFTAVFLLIGIALRMGLKHTAAATRPPAAPFPWWGWTGLAVTLGGWVLAWNRFPWLGQLQYHTFLPLWLGYILVVNGLCVRRSGSSLLTGAPGRFVLLFPASAIFWWFFEYLNRFVQNWYYLNLEHFTPGAYILFATLAFSTVLPAVISTTRLLQTFPLFHTGLQALIPIRPRAPRRLSLAALILSGAGLLLIGIFPDILFPLLWVSPLLIIISLQSIIGGKTIFPPLAQGDWGLILSSTLAALVCGFFWELWNVGSLARWEYAIPYVHCCKVFEMPILGYLGYLPFGLECMVVERGIMGHAGGITLRQ